jgi:hypothetical protein
MTKKDVENNLLVALTAAMGDVRSANNALSKPISNISINDAIFHAQTAMDNIDRAMGLLAKMRDATEPSSLASALCGMIVDHNRGISKPRATSPINAAIARRRLEVAQ